VVWCVVCWPAGLCIVHLSTPVAAHHPPGAYKLLPTSTSDPKCQGPTGLWKAAININPLDSKTSGSALMPLSASDASASSSAFSRRLQSQMAEQLQSAPEVFALVAECNGAECSYEYQGWWVVLGSCPGGNSGALAVYALEGCMASLCLRGHVRTLCSLSFRPGRPRGDAFITPFV